LETSVSEQRIAPCDAGTLTPLGFNEAATESRGSLFWPLGIYSALATGFFGRFLLARGADAHISVGPDAGLFMWFLVWWPHSIAEHLNPFFTNSVWFPDGFHLASQTGIPLAALIASPITAIFGPLSAFNILCLVCPVLNAWCAFILCRYLSRRYWASILGGYIYGFSPLILSELRFGHLHIALAFLVPLIAYVLIRCARHELATTRCMIIVSLLFVGQFLLSLETFATFILFGAFAILVCYRMGGVLGNDVRAIVRPAIYGLALSLIIVSPYLYYFFRSDMIGSGSAGFDPAQFSTDLLNFIVPTETLEVGGQAMLRSISKQFLGGWSAESGAYLSLPILGILIAYFRRHMSQPGSRLLMFVLLAVMIASLGPRLHLLGREYPIALPYWPLVDLPLLNNALPARFMMYGHLLAAVVVSLWFAYSGAGPTMKLGLALAILVLGMPNAASRLWTADVDVPAFFNSDLYRQYLTEHETIVTLPYGYKGDCMLWQAKTRMYFSLAEGYGSSRPLNFRLWPIGDALLRSTYTPDAVTQLKMFLAAHDVGAIVVTEDGLPAWRTLLSGLGSEPLHVGGVWLYRMKRETADGRRPAADQARIEFDRERMRQLMLASDAYLAQSGSPESLSVLELVERDMIHRDSIVGPPVTIDLGGPPAPNVIIDPHLAYSLYAEGGGDNEIRLGEIASSPGAELVANRLRGIADKTYFPQPGVVPRFDRMPLQLGWLVVSLRPQKLSRAIAQLGPAALPELRADAGRE